MKFIKVQQVYHVGGIHNDSFCKVKEIVYVNVSDIKQISFDPDKLTKVNGEEVRTFMIFTSIEPMHVVSEDLEFITGLKTFMPRMP